MHPKVGLLILNHGSPSSPAVADVAAYLRRFLTDGRVLTIPSLLRQLLVRGIIVPRRAQCSASNYRRIWDDENQKFPLVTYTDQIAHGLAERLSLPTAVAMRYSQPTPCQAFKQLIDCGVDRFVLVPLYPHYAMSSYETAVDHALQAAQRLDIRAHVKILPPFFDHQLYIEALAAGIRPVIERQHTQKLLISLHSIPISHLDKTCHTQLGLPHPADCCTAYQSTATVCYQYQCRQTAALVAQRLDPLLVSDQIELVYQSRIGRGLWLQPHLLERIKTLATQGIRRIAVVCPGFVCDCLETLDEIDREVRASFLAHGGESFEYIPCLNSSSSWLDALCAIIRPIISAQQV